MLLPDVKEVEAAHVRQKLHREYDSSCLAHSDQSCKT